MATYAGPLRADKFFVVHTRFIEATCKLERAAQKRNAVGPQDASKTKKQSKNKDSNVINDHLREEENWRGKNRIHSKDVCSESEQFFEPASDPNVDDFLLEKISFAPNAVRQYETKCLASPTEICDVRIPSDTLEVNQFKVEKKVSSIPEFNNKIRGKYLAAFPNIRLMHAKRLRKKNNSTLQNGGQLPAIWIEKRMVQLKNTCPFDSIVEICSIAYIDNFNYRTEVDAFGDTNSTLNLIKTYASQGPSNHTYSERAGSNFE